MDNTRFTKGNWEVVEHSWSDTSLVCGKYTIATKSIYDEATEDNQDELETEVQYNFRLLSKAPEMLFLLNDLLNDKGLNDVSVREIKLLIRQATEI